MTACPLMEARQAVPAVYTLVLKHPKIGGTAIIQFDRSVYWTSKWGMGKDPVEIKTVKSGLFQIVERHHDQGLTGLLVDQIFRNGCWSIEAKE